MEGQILREIMEEYQRLRDKNERIISQRREELFEKMPALQELELKISRLGFEAVRKQLVQSDADVSEIEEELDKLGRMKREILVEIGATPDYLDPIYECPKCEDTGYLPSGEKCDCLKQKLAVRLYDMSNLQYILEKENFEHFNIELFSKEIFEKEGISPRENMDFILDVVKQFIRNFPKKNDENLLFYGTTGLGKTYLSNCIAKELLDQNFLVIYQTAFTFLDILERRKFRRDDSEELDLAYRMLFDCDLLIIDDLGTELSNQFTNSEIFNIVNTRLIRGKKTLISTNLNPMELSQVYSDRIFSRIFQKFMPLKFFGKDLRWEQGM